MKIIKTLVTVLSATLLACSANAGSRDDASESQNTENMKSVIVYFTHSGNTELAAKEVAAATGAPMIRLYPEQPYTAADVDWTVDTSRCTREHLDPTMRPAIKPVDVNFAEIDTLFIGFPIWWHEEPAVIRTFLDKYADQLKGKVIYPFCTSYESPMTEADATLRKGYPSLNWKNGLRLPASKEQIKEWFNQ